MDGPSGEFPLQVVNFLHLLEQLLLPVVLALQPLPPQHLAAGQRLAERHCVDEAILEDPGVGPHAGGVVRVVVLAEVAEFVCDVEVFELVAE